MVSPRQPQVLAERPTITDDSPVPPSDVLPSHLAPFGLSDTVDARPDAIAGRMADNDDSTPSEIHNSSGKRGGRLRVTVWMEGLC